MNGLYSLLIALSMYSRIPVPVIKWSRERMGYVMCWFPIVGILIGIFLIIWIKVAEILKFGPEITGIVGAILPILITGGIHMDGFLDTWDALSSWGERERKLVILKDSHVGAFGVIACAVYLLLEAGAMIELSRRETLFLLAPVFVMERALSGFSVVFFPCAKSSGLAATFSDEAKRLAAAVCLSVWLAASVLLAWKLGGSGGVLFATGLLGVQAAVFFWYRRMSMKEFGGITGDLAGWFLQTAEAGGIWWALIFNCI